MDYIGGVEGMNFTPITNYNNFLKNSMSFDVNSNMDFESILNKQTAQIQNTQQLQGGVQMNGFDDIMAKSSIQTVENSQPTGTMLDNFGKAIGNGLNSTNESMRAAEKAQQAFAMGENVSVHDVMIASEKASLNLGLTMQLRNKLLSAYSEINNVKV